MPTTWRTLSRDEALALKCGTCGAARGEDCVVEPVGHRRRSKLTPTRPDCPAVHWTRAFKTAQRLRRQGHAKAAGEVKQRDGGRCVSCGSSEQVEAHHVVPNHLNGQSLAKHMVMLCKSCHDEVHGQGYTVELLRSISEATGVLWTRVRCGTCKTWHAELSDPPPFVR